MPQLVSDMLSRIKKLALSLLSLHQIVLPSWFSAFFHISNIGSFYLHVFPGYTVGYNFSGLQIGLESECAIG